MTVISLMHLKEKWTAGGVAKGKEDEDDEDDDEDEEEEEDDEEEEEEGRTESQRKLLMNPTTRLSMRDWRKGFLTVETKDLDVICGISLAA